MAKFVLLGFHDAKPGGDEEFNDWHENSHMKEVCEVPGVVSARRYELNPNSPVKPETKYLVIYEIEADDPKTVLAEFARRSGTSWTPAPASADPEKSKIMIFQQRA